MAANPVNDWIDFMPDTVTIQAFTGYDGTGQAKPTYSSTLATYPCRVELKNHLVIDHLGREIMARGRVIMGTAVVVGMQDKITLPAGYIPLNPPLISVNVVPDENGNHHTTLEIG